jgi:predicted nucleic acid-binding Zn ribbon protein
MPVFEIRCLACSVTEDCYLAKWDLPDPPCPQCGAGRERLVSRFGVPFSGSIHKYMDPTREGASQDGFWAYRKISSVSGQPEATWIGDMQTLKEFNKAEGLAAPGEVPTNSTISADGKRLLSTGMPGQWSSYDPNLIPSRVWEMDKSRTSLHGNDPVPQSSGPPVSGGAASPEMIQRFTAEAGG